MGTGSRRPTKLALLTVAFLAALLSVVLMEEPIGGAPGPEALPASPRGVVGAEKTKTSPSTTSTSAAVPGPTPTATTPATTPTSSSRPCLSPWSTTPEPVPAPSGTGERIG